MYYFRLIVSYTIILFFSKNVLSQSLDIAEYRAFYEFKHIDDTTRRNDPLTSEMVLYMGNYGTLYRSVRDEESSLLLFLAKGGLKEKFNILEETSSQIFMDNKSVRIARVMDNIYKITENEIKINWEIFDETKEVEGYLAQRAECNFGGRKYTAWFSSEIPLPYGPWKLRGLPGLILLCEDNKSEVSFKFTGLEKMDKNDKINITIPNNFRIQKVSAAQFEKIYKAFDRDPISFMKGSLGISDKQIFQPNTPDTKYYNNPLEIYEKE